MIINQELLTKMQKEAVTRMEELLIDKNIVDQIKTEWSLQISDEKSFYKIESDEDLIALEIFNSKNIGLAYLGIKSHNMISFLYICTNEEEWEQELGAINSGYQAAFVYNIINPCCSEIGDIFLDTSNNKLKRIG